MKFKRVFCRHICGGSTNHMAMLIAVVLVIVTLKVIGVGMVLVWCGDCNGIVWY